MEWIRSMLTYISAIYSSAEEHRVYVEELQNILRHEIRAKRIVDFGCGDGSEAIALCYLLDADEVVGIDTGESFIENARSTVRSLQEDIEKLPQALKLASQSFEIPEDIESRIQVIMPFLRALRGKQLKFLLGDMTQPSLDTQNFDLVFCKYALHHVFCDKGIEATHGAISQMANVAKSGGLIVVIVPSTCGNNDKNVELKTLFDGQNKLTLVEIRQLRPELVFYVYRKL